LTSLKGRVEGGRKEEEEEGKEEEEEEEEEEEGKEEEVKVLPQTKWVRALFEVGREEGREGGRKVQLKTYMC
jgi:hypothetical protein